MLYRYNGKIYIKPFGDKLVEVNIHKKGKEYNVEPTDKIVIITSEISQELYTVPIEEAYKMVNRSSFSKE